MMQQRQFEAALFYLQISDDGVLHVLFLLLQEVKTDSI